MGLVSPPFATTRIFSWDMELITGDKKRSSNNFFWDVAIHNSPGTTYYDPTMPRLYIWDSVRGKLSAVYKTYVDDLKTIAATQ